MPAELCESMLRKELAIDEMELKNGLLSLPQKPGLGFELNLDALKKFTVA